MKLNGEKLNNVDHFKYLGSVIDKDGTADRDLDHRVQAARSSSINLTGVLYDRKIPLRLKAKAYETIIRPALTCGSECWALKMTNKRKYAITETGMLRGILEVSRRIHAKRGNPTHSTRFTDRRGYTLWPSSLVWTCPETRGQQRNPQSDGPGNTRYQTTRRHKKTWHQQIKDDMADVGVTQYVPLDRKELRRRTRPTARRLGKGHQGEQGEQAK